MSSGFTLPISMMTPPVTPVIRGDGEVATDAKIAMSWLLVRVRLRTAIVITTCTAFGSAFAWLVLLDVRGDVHGKEIHHQARVAEVTTIHAVLSAEQTLGLQSPPPMPMKVQAIDAPWTPAPADAKPWTPAPYASLQLPAKSLSIAESENDGESAQ
ncbi:MAG: hypothetical protein ABI183_21475 [Polyangiaceae bacterium]